MFDKYLKSFKNFFTKYRSIISAIIYMLLVFVVIYGMSSGVYDGFPGIIPYVIIAIFLFMAFIRLYQCITVGISSDKGIKKSSDEKKQ